MTVMLTSFITLSSFSIINNQSASANHLNQYITVYSITRNRHGRIIKTSVGTFYLGKSQDVVYETGQGRIYGYWEFISSNSVMEPNYNNIYIGNRFYYLHEDKFTDEPYMIRLH